ncbi:NADP-dependent oxidoreductase [Vineibacter terrae]|uniref:NADP-dependent oxidoreductase n=1 Tax=Vineibacter terrae TaxID=2586908 RepID=A0A5C8PGB3_9HYPH|nr:NADP-dependent oxidoreductase [Vineibacter terrae]TXL72816.1 NADP-dependent oxidoreductase [Vineibacter terrae]
MAEMNRRVLLKSRPQGEPTLANFDVVDAPIPEPKDGEYLSRTIWLSLDPYMRGRMSEAKGYAANVNLGDAMVGGTVGQVLKSRNPKFKEGDFVVEYSGWQSHAVSNGAMSMKLDPDAAPLSAALSVLGMPGQTAWWGLMQIGQPQARETVVVSAASGAVGSVVGQLARLHGCRAVGIAGGKEKCDYVVKELGFDACVDYRAEGANLFKALRAACPKGIDVYFENVGGAVQAAVVPQLNDFARVPLCGLISQYNEMQMNPGPDWRLLLVKRALVKGFIVSDHFAEMAGFWKEVPAAVKAGKIKYREDVVKGLDNAPEAFIGLLKGRNFGKLLVQVSDDPTRR